MLRQSAFTGTKRLLKGGLHCHTTRSDGQCTPEEVIELHEQNGYDFLAITDHRLYNYQNFVPGSKLTILPGMEMDRNIGPRRVHCFHSVWLGPDTADNPYRQDEAFPTGIIGGYRDFQPLLDEAHARRQLTLYCHPQWSGTFTREFEQLEGICALELWNSGCVLDFDLDQNNGFIWDELLLSGKRIWGVAVDDGHKREHHCKGWVRVKAENNVAAILKAIENGDFYASTGPEIFDFYVDDNRVAHVKCSPCSHVRFTSGNGRMAKQYGAPVTEMASAIPALENDPYIRVEVTDAQGRMAWSNPIFL